VPVTDPQAQGRGASEVVGAGHGSLQDDWTPVPCFEAGCGVFVVAPLDQLYRRRIAWIISVAALAGVVQ
jgi:hypothetical protein